MAEEFSKAVDDGVKLSKRIYFGKDRATAPPKPPPPMERMPTHAFLPTAPMVYAVIHDPAIVDNPDIPSYQPHVHGRCDPPALIPLQMNGVELDVNCYLDTAIVKVTGSWRVHCVMGSRSCDCRIAIPMGEQGCILGVEVEVPRKSYSTQLVERLDKEMENAVQPENGGFVTPNIFTLLIPQIDGGTNISITLSWSQKLVYNDGHYTLNIPYQFPEYVTPAVKKISKKEKIQLSVNSGTGTEVLCRTCSHPLKEIKRQVGKLGFTYETEVLKWSNADFNFSYTVSSSHFFGSVLLQSPSVHDTDQREMFSVYLLPGSQQSKKVFRKEVVFAVDISGSMIGKPLESTQNAISTALSMLNADDSFNIIAFNSETNLFSTSMELPTNEAIERAIQWMSINLTAEGTTNMLPPLEKAVEMLSNTSSSVPMIFFVTDGAVEDERQICDVMKTRLANSGSICPRIYTFGIGTYCNHYFLQMLSAISRGGHEAVYDLDSIEFQMERAFTRALSTVLANISIEEFDNLDEVEVYPSCIPDLSSAKPLLISGRYRGKFPENPKANGLIGDLSEVVIDLKIQSTKNIPLSMVNAKQQIDLLTAQTWHSNSKQLEEKVAKLSIQTGFISEYTRMFLLENVEGKKTKESARTQKASTSEPQQLLARTIPLERLSIGFGDLLATAENLPPGFGEAKAPDAAELFAKAASNCCTSVLSYCCCMCCIECCSKLNNQCVVVLTQFCGALACLGCFECCSAICCCGEDGN